MQTLGTIVEESATRIRWAVPANAPSAVRSPSFVLEGRNAHITWDQDTVEVVCSGFNPLRVDPKLSCDATVIPHPQMGGSSHADGTVHCNKASVPRLPEGAHLCLDLAG